MHQLGLLFTDGFNRSFYDPIVVGIVACIVLALLFDVVIVVVTRLLTPWQRATKACGMIPDILAWLTDPAHWTGPDGVPARTLEHL